jgi:hypothetical protein
MSRSRVLIVAVTLVIVAASAFVAATVRGSHAGGQDLSAFSEPQGHEFLVEGRAVEAGVVPFTHTTKRSDAVTVDLRLTKGTFAPNASVEDERGGRLTPALTVSGCTVSPGSATAINTNQPLAAFEWTWSISGCVAGTQSVQLALEFESTTRKNPQVYEYYSKLGVTDPQSVGDSMDLALKMIYVVSGALGILSAILGLGKKEPAKEAA